jgi:hypothetical protein
VSTSSTSCTASASRLIASMRLARVCRAAGACPGPVGPRTPAAAPVGVGEGEGGGRLDRDLIVGELRGEVEPREGVVEIKRPHPHRDHRTSQPLPRPWPQVDHPPSSDGPAASGTYAYIWDLDHQSAGGLALYRLAPAGPLLDCRLLEPATDRARLRGGHSGSSARAPMPLEHGPH